MRRPLAACVLLVTLSAAATQQQVSGKDYIEAFIKIATERGLFATGEQWDRVKAYARANAPRTTDSLSAYPIVAQSIRSLGDHHGGLNPTEAQTADYKQRYGKLWVEADFKKPASKFMNRTEVTFSDRRLANGPRVRILVVPRIFQNEDMKAYAAKLFDASVTAPPSVCAFLLDLRGNFGGNMWPMLAGLSPLLGPGDAGAFSDRAGAPVKWRIAPGRSGEVYADGRSGDNFVIQDARLPSGRLKQLPVALLIDDGVLSSGEVITIAFRGRPRTRSFGVHTFGLSTNNTPFDMPDGGQIYLATGVYMDRKGRSYPNGIAPEVTADPADGPNGALSPAGKAALAWLSRQPGCRKIGGSAIRR